MKNDILKSIVTIIVLMFIGGILTTIGIEIFIPTYVYTSIGNFLITFLMGGYGFVTILGVLSCILVPSDVITDEF